MKKLQTFSYVLKNSALKPAYYADVLKAPFWFSLKYFVFLFVLLNLITALTISIFLITKASPYLKKFKNEGLGLFPQELAINIKNGATLTNVQEPYFIPLKPEIFPQEFKEALKTQPIYNIAVIDTKAQPSEIKKYQTFILLTKNDIAFLGGNKEIRIQSLEEVKDFSLDYAKAKQFWQEISPFLNWLIPLLIAAFFLIIPPLAVLFKFIYLVIISLFTFILVKFFKNISLGYAKVLQINLQAVTLPTLITAIFQLFGTVPQIPFFQTIILIIFNLIIFTSLKPIVKK